MIDDHLNSLVLEEAHIVSVGKGLNELVALIGLVIDAGNVKVLKSHGCEWCVRVVDEQVSLDALLSRPDLSLTNGIFVDLFDSSLEPGVGSMHDALLLWWPLRGVRERCGGLEAAVQGSYFISPEHSFELTSIVGLARLPGERVSFILG